MQVNTNYKKLSESYLFQTIAKKVTDFEQLHPDQPVIRLGIGDVTLPLASGVIEALHEAVDEQASSDTFRGYGPEGGYDFLRQAIVENDFIDRGVAVSIDEVFVSAGAKSDCGDIQELFGPDVTVAVGDPVYPVYVDSNVLAGRSGEWNETTKQWEKLVYLPSTAENNFVPDLPSEPVDLIYLCYPNNPTGTTLTKDQLQKWIDFAVGNGSVIIFDAAYEAYISRDNVPHSIYECEGAKQCAIEIRSFSKRAGFTGLRLGYAVVPKDLVFNGQSINTMWARRQTTKFNGAPYIVQRAGYATYQEPAKSEIDEQIAYYMKNAKLIRDSLIEAGIETYGGVDSPYIWMKVPGGKTSWQFFDELLEQAQVVGTPGSGFGPSGEGYFRLTAFNTYENTKEAVERIKKMFVNV